MVTRKNSTGKEVVIGRHVGDKIAVPAIAKIYPEALPYWNEDYKEWWAYQLFSIRKLTEGECLRLMDVPEELIVKMCQSPELSKSAIYKLAGNSIVVACIRYIIRNIYKGEGDPFDIFSVPFRAKVPDTINLVTLCSGYDSQAIALGQVSLELGCKFDLLAWSEFDPESKRPLDKQPAVVAHNLLFPQWADRNVGDMTKVDWDAVKATWGGQKDVDILTYSTPCQSISQAGKREGMKEGSDTRSAILWYTENAIRSLRPKFLLQENVRAIINSTNIDDFKAWQNRVSSLGYTSYYTIMNAKDFGIPQNRERMFMLSVRNDMVGEDGNKLEDYTFPKPFPLTKCIADILDEKVDDCYFLKADSVLKFLQKNEEENEKGVIYDVVDHHLTQEELESYWGV